MILLRCVLSIYVHTGASRYISVQLRILIETSHPVCNVKINPGNITHCTSRFFRAIERSELVFGIEQSVAAPSVQ